MIINRKSIILISTVLLAMAACSRGPNNPGYTYMPDMQYYQAYETYDVNPFSWDSTTEMKPVEGTIPRGFQPFHYPNNIDGYAKAGEELSNPFKPTKENIDTGKWFFNVYCAVCHGQDGKADGPIVKRGVFPPPPSYFTDYMLNLPDGKKFFTIQYGKNLMGSYASQLTKSERWKVILYINKMQQDYLASQSGGKSDSTSQ